MALMQSCKRLNDYSYFINQVDAGRNQGLSLKLAIAKAMDTCIKNDILKDILTKNQAEVVDMILSHYDKKQYEQTLREEGFEDGCKKQREQDIVYMLSIGKTPEQISEFCGFDLSQVQTIAKHNNK